MVSLNLLSAALLVVAVVVVARWADHQLQPAILVPAEREGKSGSRSSLLAIDPRWHGRALAIFSVVVFAHWAEHLWQAGQIWALDWPREKALGALGVLAPSLVKSEWLHWGYNLLVLVGAAMLVPAFAGRARRWWKGAVAVQTWHFFEHALLLIQVLFHTNLLGREVPTSVVQLFAPRVELHLFYNGIVTALLLIGLAYHLRGRVWGRSLSGRVAATN